MGINNQFNVNLGCNGKHKTKRVDILDVFYDLKRRIKITRKSRIIASKRLRTKHEYFEKITTFYSVLVLLFSVAFIDNVDAVQILLVLSISLTFFTMFLNNKNYKERAGNFETNYQHLDILLNKIERLETNLDSIDMETVKGLHRDYEKLLIEKENHHDIDYMTSSEELKSSNKQEIVSYHRKTKTIHFLLAIYPLILIILIFTFRWIVELYKTWF
ncbi:SLATT domain-containing protein [Sporosarcina sp. FSL W8-0480]|uniref:SLATT domain-containing protein n=1 Tax=Sporosarcina sp. FSL W8-0480 TaxID=2954701 RepID=UPI0030D74CB7